LLHTKSRRRTLSYGLSNSVFRFTSAVYSSGFHHAVQRGNIDLNF
jgi:hypothetical protein